ncbi:putative baseplate assembly protein [Azospirillum picis]|uniref:Baseplate assembly protein n=1 Tax=Azospirillum picis TaxID=488438 RepID=A0ABU0MSS4_9PROT|nr:putative baseplate assembly protein [Azospirillum picis]MBP2302794.1 hypothetical protein [Azospirillum picis]MDQ0536544.1 hypothetical protein [Azospirillum picis]
MTGQYFCHAPGRVVALREAAAGSPAVLLNGIHFLEVDPGQRRLRVHFVHPLDLVPAAPLTPANVEIRGGARVRNPAVTAIAPENEVLTVDVATAGDFSRYRLRLVASAGTGVPPDGIDPALAEIEFSFKADCPSDFDCRPAATCPPDPAAGPAVDYFARDYATVRRLILDRMSVLMPEWCERSAADLWVTLAEAIAYRADEIAYFQDAVGTEAYLGTARQRVSVRRHTRLLDYPFHDGRNARTFVAFEVEPAADGQVLNGCDPETGLGGTLVFTTVPGLGPAVSQDDADTGLRAGAQPFELLEPVTLFSAHNGIAFHTWSDDECCLPKGATLAFLRDDPGNRLRLRAGDILIFEAMKSTTTGEKVDADRLRRHAVRLTHVDPEARMKGGVRGVSSPRRDPVTGEAFVEIEWGEGDALPFPLCLSKRIGGALVDGMAAVAGNVGLADHGVTVAREERPEPLAGGRTPRFRLASTAVALLTQQGRVRVPGSDEVVLIDRSKAASAALVCEMADVRPALEVRSGSDQRRWNVRRDLLASGGAANDLVVEVENDGRAFLRFGDGVNGRPPRPGEDLTARIRVGNGVAGNVGAEAIGHAVAAFGGISRVRNPLPATGGVDAEPMLKARLDAPEAFRRQERAVTEADYAEVVERDPRVERAVATRRWTGSWYTMFITVDRRGSETIDPAFEAALAAHVERYRLAGHDVEIDGPRYVALDVALHVCAKPGYFPTDIESRLLDRFSAGLRSDREPGFFHPDRLTFGEPVYLSAVIAAAMDVTGVAFVTPLTFQRLGRSPAGEIEAGRIAMQRLEIARLDNDPNAPENGRIRFEVETKGQAR